MKFTEALQVVGVTCFDRPQDLPQGVREIEADFVANFQRIFGNAKPFTPPRLTHPSPEASGGSFSGDLK